MPEPGEDYPRTTAEFNARFATEEACWRYLVGIRWPGGFRCQRCGSEKAWLITRGLFECGKCHRQVSATAGTIFQDTRKPLRLGFQVMWWVVGQKQRASALGLNRVMGIGSYKTAWAWLHKLRRAMVRPGRERLTGDVEVDETYVGGVEPGGGRRHLGNKALVVIAAQADGDGIGRIRMRRILDASSQSLHACVKDVMEPGSTVITDGWDGYDGFKTAGYKYKHRIRVISGSGKTASVLLPRVHRIASLVKRWLLGTHRGAVSRDHIIWIITSTSLRSGSIAGPRDTVANCSTACSSKQSRWGQFPFPS